MMKKKVSIIDIAKHVGTSTAAVSYVLNGKAKEKRISKDLIDRIKKAAEEMKYTPNLVARSLRRGTSDTIGLIVPDISNSFFSEMSRYIELEAYEMGYSVIIGNTDEDAVKSARIIDVMENRQVDGYIIAPAEGSEEQIQSLVNKKKPVVIVDRIFNSLDVSRVVLNNHKATFDACNCLLESGYEHIAAMGYKTSMVHIRDRFKGYKDALKQSASPQKPKLIEIDYHNSQNEIEKSLNRLFNGKKKIDAIIFLTNSLAVQGLYYFVKNGIKIPHDVAIIGFDGNIAFDLFSPSLTYVKQPLKEICNQALKCLKNQLDGENLTAHIKMEGELIIRDSCKNPRAVTQDISINQSKVS
jgi:LacI family transcriptional regulator